MGTLALSPVWKAGTSKHHISSSLYLQTSSASSSFSCVVYGVCFYQEKQKDAQLKLVLQNIIKVGPTRYGTVPNNDAQDGKIKSYFRIL